MVIEDLPSSRGLGCAESEMNSAGVYGAVVLATGRADAE
jgi:hypothetical protein